MASARSILVALMALAPTAALAHGPDGHPPDPNLHVNPKLKDCSVEFASNLTQSAFHRFTREFGSVSAFKLMSPPTTLGKWGVSVAVEHSSFTVEEKSDAWNDTFAHPDSYHELGSDLGFPKLSLRMGVSDHTDVGAYYTENPNANYGWLGVDVKHGLLRESETTPVSLALRGAYTKTLYVQDMDMHAFTADVAAGKTLWKVFTPYAGLGGDLVVARETSDAVALEDEVQLVPHVLGGAQVRYWHLALGAEVHRTALTSYEIQIAALF
jgi:hypothetical protein